MHRSTLLTISALRQRHVKESNTNAAIVDALTAERDALKQELAETRAALRELREATSARQKAYDEVVRLHRERNIATAMRVERNGGWLQ